MRIWTLHPGYLDSRGLVAVWREALLAQKVLMGATKGYKHHPQLIRFREQAEPLQAIASYLSSLVTEADRRGYRFNAGKISTTPCQGDIEETNGQLHYEWLHLMRKLEARSPSSFDAVKTLTNIKAHPLFKIVPGEVRVWEKMDRIESPDFEANV